MQELRVHPAAGTVRFHCQRAATALLQVVEQQSDQQSLADASVGAGDEDDALCAGSVHGQDSITAPTAGTQANRNLLNGCSGSLPRARFQESRFKSTLDFQA
jgi:hypothetical protein